MFDDKGIREIIVNRDEQLSRQTLCTTESETFYNPLHTKYQASTPTPSIGVGLGS